MTGIGNTLLYSYTTSKTAHVPRSVKDVLAGFTKNEDEKKPTADVSKMRRALRCGAENLANETHVGVIDNMQLYAKALEKQRKNTNETALAKQKLKYSFKKISSKIVSCKTSTAAREVVSSAKREIEKLKRAKRSGRYDEEEIAEALDHAKAMERIARKKVRHLEEEEMAKRCSSDSGKGIPVVDEEAPADDKDPVKEEIGKLRDEIDEMADKAANEEYVESGAVTNEMISEMADDLEEMIDAIAELNDLMDEILSDPVDMDPEDIDAMTTKHRNKEMKEITKADADYLKAMFEHFENIRTDGEMTTSSIDVAL